MTRPLAPPTRPQWLTAAATVALIVFATIVLIAGRGPLPALGSRPAGEGSPPNVASSAPLDPRIASIASRHPAELIEAIAQFRASVSPARARADAARIGGRVTAQLHIIPALAVKLTAAQARSLAANPDLHSVSLNTQVKPQGEPGNLSADQLGTTFNQSLDAPALWHIGGTGAGVGVAVIDTGIDGGLPDFRSSHDGRSRVSVSAVINPSAKTAADSYGHGTDVAGIIAGNSENRDPSDPLRGRFAGVAPNANLISIKVSDEQGNATVLDVIYGLQFALDFRHRYDIRVVNLSVDSTTPQSYTSDPLDAAVESAWLHGLVVVAAAGNRGTASDAVQYSPANDPYVITVGAVDEHGTPDPASHTIADWSSSGTTRDGYAKPDLYAPGAHIVSNLAPNSAFASMCPTCIVDAQYIRAGGTSMAAPMISGLVADVLELNPHWTPDQIKGALTDPNVWSSGLPEVDALKIAGLRSPPLADQKLTPNNLLTDGAGSIDYTRSSWSRSSWSVASGSLSSDFTRSSWSCNCSQTSAGQINPSRSSWSAANWAMRDLG
jgi:serine protease AprX